MSRVTNGPISPDLEHLLLPEYVKYYKTHLQHQVPIQNQTPEEQRASSSTSTGHDMAPIEEVKTKEVTFARAESSGDKLTIRCLTPEGERPSAGWPVVIYFHGGGWKFGNLDSEMPRCTRLCQWTEAVARSAGNVSLQLDLTKVVIGGQSAGANIAAAAVHRAIDQEWGPIKWQLLLVPITDNRETDKDRGQYRKAPGPSAEKMLFYRKAYVEDNDPGHWEISPLHASDEQFRRLPPAIIVVAEVDVLRGDGERYRDKMENNNVSAELIIMKKLPHAALTLGGQLKNVEDSVTRFCQSLKIALGSRGPKEEPNETQ